MKKHILLILSGLIAFTSFGQVKEELPFSTINFVRSGNFFGSSCRSYITVSNQRQFLLGNSCVVKYKIYSAGNVTATAEVYCPGVNGNPSSSHVEQISVDVKHGQEYYAFYNAGKFDLVEKERVQKFLDKEKNIMQQEENTEHPINPESLKHTAKKEDKGQASCFLINDQGYLITNYHCIVNAKEISIRGISGDFKTKFGATLVASDPSNDLALLKIDSKIVTYAMPPYSLRTAGVVQAEKAYALGFPEVQAMGEELKITEGIISAKSGPQGDISKFQISAIINPGNSGGPLIDEDGNVIGVIYAKSTIADAAGYAIKASYVETFLKNVDHFTYPAFTNTIKEKSLPQKVAAIKDFIFIVETQ